MSATNQSLKNRKLGAFVGGIVGDAYGSQWEFLPRDSYEISPDMGWTVFQLPPGSVQKTLEFTVKSYNENYCSINEDFDSLSTSS